jgi:TRAP-type uncharacterized transport system fused permease subunit
MDVASVAVPTAACGIIIGIVSRSGTAIKIAKIITNLGEGSIALALVVAMLGCLVMGMGLPTVASYLMANILFCPTLIQMGISKLAANMFVFYFGVFAQITPPVCLAAYAAAGIAEASQWKTGWTAFNYSIVAFLMPFVFVFKPEMLMQGTFGQIAITFTVQLLGIIMLAAAVSGFMFVPMDKMWQRILLAMLSIFIIIPETITTIVGALFCLLISVYFFFKKRKQLQLDVNIQNTDNYI